MLVKFAYASLLLLTVACRGEEGTQPTIDTGLQAPAADTGVQAPDSTAAESSTAQLTSAAAGIPFGDFHLPASEFGSGTYTGSLQALWPSGGYQVLDAASAGDARIVISLAGSRTGYTNADGTFNLSKWKARVAGFKGYDFAQYVASGTVIGHYLVDEPFCTSCWEGRVIAAGTLEEMARYSKSLWPTIPTGVRSYPSVMPLQASGRLISRGPSGEVRSTGRLWR